jgi:hypothetical protein
MISFQMKWTWGEAPLMQKPGACTIKLFTAAFHSLPSLSSRLEWRTVKGSIIEAPALPATIRLVWKGLTVTNSDKYSSLLRYEIKYDCKKVL